MSSIEAIPQRLATALGEIEGLTDPDLRAEYLIELASRFRPVPAEVQTPPYPEDALVPACESKAFVFPVDRIDGTLDFYFAVENPHGVSAKALAALLQETLSGAPLDEVEAISPELVTSLFGPHLSMGKDQGLRNLVLAARRAASRRR